MHVSSWLLIGFKNKYGQQTKPKEFAQCICNVWQKESGEGGGGSAYNLIKACSMLLPGCLSMVWAFWPHNAQNIQVILKACIMLSLSRTHTCSIRLDDNELNRETESLAEPYFVKSLCVCVCERWKRNDSHCTGIFVAKPFWIFLVLKTLLVTDL